MNTISVKVSAKSLRGKFNGCDPDYIANVCHGACCRTSSHSDGIIVSVDPSEKELVMSGPIPVQISSKNKIVPVNKRCPNQTKENLCAVHGTPHKPFGCVASPFTLNKNHTLIVRNRYRLLKCFNDGKKIPAYIAFRDSLVALFGEENTCRIETHLNAGGGDLQVPMENRIAAIVLQKNEISNVAQKTSAPIAGCTKSRSSWVKGCRCKDCDGLENAYQKSRRDQRKVKAPPVEQKIVVGDKMKAWQHGYDLELLQDLARRFQSHDGDRCLGVFSKVKENAVAAWLSKGRLIETPSGAVVLRKAKGSQSVKDFRGVVVARVQADTVVIERACGKAEDIYTAIENAAQGGPVYWKSWTDHLEELSAATVLKLRRIGTTISAASELRAILCRGIAVIDRPSLLDTVGIQRCGEEIQVPPEISEWPLLVAEIWQDHYSTYNKRKSWHAVALRGFGGDPAFIEKPAEMSKKWKTEHSDMLDAPCIETPLLDSLPGARLVLDQFQTDTERVRLMRLTGQGGELTRHADITDRNAGLANGQIARLHYPIVTNPEVQFTSWNLNNAPITTHMSAGNWWYLDVRKPHAAINTASSERIHFVVDAVANDWLRSFIAAGAES